MKNTLVLVLLVIMSNISFGQSKCDFFDIARMKISATNINTTASDFGPAFVKNELWYSQFTDKEIAKLARGAKRKVYYNIFTSPVDNFGEILGKGNIVLEEVSKGYHAGPVSYCAKTSELFVTLSNISDVLVEGKVFQKAKIRLKIIVLKEEDGAWKLKEDFPFNSAAYSVGHPAISLTGDTLLFASNIPDYGYGKTDIYMSVRQNGKWQKPINLGQEINTIENEMFPFLFRNNTLIFASSGRKEGKGGLDLYYSCLTQSGFSTPESISELNSSSDDFALTIHPNEKIGYFNSKRAGGTGDDDIYKIEIEVPVMKTVAGKVIDDATEQPIAGAKVVLTNCNNKELGKVNSDLSGKFSFLIEEEDCLMLACSKTPYHNEELKITKANTIIRLKGDYDLELRVIDKKSLAVIPNVSVTFNDGDYNTNEQGLIKRQLKAHSNYRAISDIDGYMNESVSFSTDKVPFGTIKKTIKVEKVVVGQKFTLENIYYDFNKWDILPESEIELDKLVKVMNDNSSWKVELGSHTDSRGSDKYNLRLSQKRSDSAVDYIISKGIDKNRITAKGYGETQLVNKCKNGIKCSDEEHRKNRRTEFKILKI
jgi:outer membrane protein OmpA-like peptidoglycan-associated protein